MRYKSRERGEKRHGPGLRLIELRSFLGSGEAASVYDLASRFQMSIRNAARYIDALRESGEQISEEWRGKRKVFRLAPRSSLTGPPPRTTVPAPATRLGGTSVRIWFSSRVMPIVKEQRWIPVPGSRPSGRGVVLSFEIDDTASLRRYVLSFADDAEILAPASLRAELARDLSRAARRYRKSPPG